MMTDIAARRPRTWGPRPPSRNVRHHDRLTRPGKTTTLRLVAGFEQPSSGRVLVDGRDMAGTPPSKRPVNTVFQSYALFPHLRVFDNVAFGLRRAKVARADIARRVGEALDLVELAEF